MTESPWKRTAGRGRDNPRPDLRVLLASPLEHDLDVPFRDYFANFQVQDRARTAVEEVVHALENDSYPNERHIGMPVLVPLDLANRPLYHSQI